MVRLAVVGRAIGWRLAARRGALADASKAAVAVRLSSEVARKATIVGTGVFLATLMGESPVALSMAASPPEASATGVRLRDV